MLVLTRKLGERIIIGHPPNEIVVTVVDVSRNQVRIGVTAPRDVPIDREELRRAKDQSKE